MSLGATYFQQVRREPFIICYWRLNEITGSAFAYDYGARFNINGLVDSAPVSSPALIQDDSLAGSYAFGGAGVNVEVPDISAIRMTGDLSLETWVLPKADSQSKVILGKMDGTGAIAAPYALSVSAGMPSLSLGNGSAQVTVTGDKPPITGIPSHIVATSFRGAMSVYLNGILVGSGLLGTQTVADVGQSLFIGSVGAATGFSGLIGEAALYSGALSASRVLRHTILGQQILLDPGHMKLGDHPVYS